MFKPSVFNIPISDNIIYNSYSGAILKLSQPIVDCISNCDNIDLLLEQGFILEFIQQFLPYYCHTGMMETPYPLFRWLLFPIVYSRTMVVGAYLAHLLAHENLEKYIVIHLAMC